MTTKEEALERGRELYAEIFDSQFSDDVLDMLGDGSDVDSTLFAMFHDATQEGYLADITDIIGSSDETPTYAVSAHRLRSLMCASLTVGMWHQKITTNLDNMWKEGTE